MIILGKPMIQSKELLRFKKLLVKRQRHQRQINRQGNITNSIDR